MKQPQSSAAAVLAACPLLLAVSFTGAQEGDRPELVKEGPGAPRMLAVAGDGTVYVSRPHAGDVLALKDTDGDGRADRQEAAVRGLKGVHGIALHGGKMYLV